MSGEKKRELSVLHFAGSYFPITGGTTTRIHNLVCDGVNRHTIVVPFPERDKYPAGTGQIEKEEVVGGVKVCRAVFEGRLGFLEKFPFVGNGLLSRRMLELVEGMEFDIMHGHNPLTSAMASFEFKRRTKIPMVYEAHGIMREKSNLPDMFGSYEGLNRMGKWVGRRALSHYEQKVVGVSDRVIVQTESAKRRMIELYGVEEGVVDVICNGVDAEKFDPNRWKERGRELRCEHGWGDKIVFLYAGYLDAVNGMDFLLDALGRMAADLRGNIKVVILGRGPREEWVHEFSESQKDLVDYLGVVGYDDMPAFYSACDVFMIPRPSCAPAETLLPMKILEAMAMEKVVLVSDVAAMAEVITDGVDGVVFGKDDAGSFLERIEAIVKGSVLSSDIGVCARRKVLERYTWETCRDKLQGIYQSLAD